MQKPINIAIAKKQLQRINDFLETPVLIIGGLAVNQFYPVRDSYDIDLVCNYDLAQKIIKKLFPAKEWELVEDNYDDYRPNYILTHKEEQYVVKFGPKITEREPYKYINWKDIEKDTVPFKYKKDVLKNIKVPFPDVQCILKLLSYIGRDQIHVQKRKQDLLDFVNLTNLKEFSADRFISFIKKWKLQKIISSFSNSIKGKEKDIYKDSSIYRLIQFFHEDKINDNEKKIIQGKIEIKR